MAFARQPLYFAIGERVSRFLFRESKPLTFTLLPKKAARSLAGCLHFAMLAPFYSSATIVSLEEPIWRAAAHCGRVQSKSRFTSLSSWDDRKFEHTELFLNP